MLYAEPLHRRVYCSKSSHIQPVFGRHNTGHRDTYKRWDPDTLRKACKAVNDSMTIRRAAEKHVPHCMTTSLAKFLQELKVVPELI